MQMHVEEYVSLGNNLIKLMFCAADIIATIGNSIDIIVNEKAGILR